MRIIKRKTHNEYVREVAELHPDIKVVGKYSGASVPILHKCRIDGYEWMARPSNIIGRMSGCPECAHVKHRTTEEYAEDLSKINPNVEVLEDFVNVKTPILHKCLIPGCGHIWKTAPDNLLSGKGCPQCNNRRIGDRSRKTHEEYVKQLSTVNPNVTVIGVYKNNSTPILHRCDIDGYEWYTIPSNLLSGSGCPKCGIKSSADHKRKSQEEYVTEVSAVNSDIRVVGKYTTAFIPIEHQCLICGNIWMSAPLNILSGNGCPRCKESSGERIIRQWLESHGINYEAQKRFYGCRDKKELPFDFYLPDYNLCIEYDGIQHRVPKEFFGGEDEFLLRVKHDSMKTRYCTDNNILLLRIQNKKDIDSLLNNFLSA